MKICKLITVDISSACMKFKQQVKLPNRVYLLEVGYSALLHYELL